MIVCIGISGVVPLILNSALDGGVGDRLQASADLPPKNVPRHPLNKGLARP